MFASVNGAVTNGRRETGSCLSHVRIAIRPTGIYSVRNTVEPKIEKLLNDLEALSNELKATGLPCYDEVIQRASAEIARIHADPKVAEQIITPGRVDE